MGRSRGQESAEELWLQEAIDDVLSTIAAVTRNDAPPTEEEWDTVRQLFLRRLEGRAVNPDWEDMRPYVDQVRTVKTQEEGGKG